MLEFSSVVLAEPSRPVAPTDHFGEVTGSRLRFPETVCSDAAAAAYPDNEERWDRLDAGPAIGMIVADGVNKNRNAGQPNFPGDASRLVVNSFLSAIAERNSSPAEIIARFPAAAQSELEEYLNTYLKRYKRTMMDFAPGPCTTAVFGYLHESGELFAGNIGDSTAIIIPRRGDVQLVFDRPSVDVLSRPDALGFQFRKNADPGLGRTVTNLAECTFSGSPLNAQAKLERGDTVIFMTDGVYRSKRPSNMSDDDFRFAPATFNHRLFDERTAQIAKIARSRMPLEDVAYAIAENGGYPDDRSVAIARLSAD